MARQLSRRRFIVHTLAASTLTVAAPLGCDASPAEGAEPAAGPSDVLVTGTDDEMLVLEVTAANKVVVRLPRVEVGQGITTAVAMMIAEELDARLADVEIPLAEARRSGNQFTGGSNSVGSLYGPARALAATARAKLVTAASRRWHVPPKTLRTRDTMVVAPDGRTATFGSLTAAAARIHRPAVSTDPKPASRHRVIGRPTSRIDARDIVTGRAKYTGDLAVAGAKPTVVARPPTLGGKVRSLDDRAARALPGVHAVVRIEEVSPSWRKPSTTPSRPGTPCGSPGRRARSRPCPTRRYEPGCGPRSRRSALRRSAPGRWAASSSSPSSGTPRWRC